MMSDADRWFVNPGRKKRHRTKARRGYGAGEHRPRVRVSGRRFIVSSQSPYKGSITQINPLLREASMFLNPRRRRSGGRRRHGGGFAAKGVMGAVRQVVTNPMDAVLTGLVGAASAYMTLSVPNNFLPFPGPGIMDRVLRALTRVATGAAIYGVGRAMAPRYASSILAGASIAALGSFGLETLGTRVVIGAGDTAAMPLLPIGSLNLGLAAYVRRPGRPGMNAYAPKMLPLPNTGMGAPRGLGAPLQIVKHRLW